MNQQGPRRRVTLCADSLCAPSATSSRADCSFLQRPPYWIVYHRLLTNFTPPHIVVGFQAECAQRRVWCDRMVMFQIPQHFALFIVHLGFLFSRYKITFWSDGSVHRVLLRLRAELYVSGPWLFFGYMPYRVYSVYFWQKLKLWSKYMFCMAWFLLKLFILFW